MAAPGYPAGGDQKFGPPPPYFEPGAQPPQAGFVNPGHVHTTTVITSEPVAPTRTYQTNLPNVSVPPI